MPQTYADRNALLKTLGYPSYAEYLKSDLWEKIRETARIEHGDQCRLCSRPSDVFHHTGYGREVLLGLSLKQLVPLCYGCHEKIEFRPNGEKRTLEKVRIHFDYLINKQPPRPKRVKKCHRCQTGLARTGFVYCRPCQRVKDDLRPMKVAKRLAKTLSPEDRTGKVFLTKAMYKKGRCSSGGWNKKQIEALGFVWASGGTPVGSYVTLGAYQLFLSLRDSHLEKKPEKKGNPQIGLAWKRYYQQRRG